MTASQSAEGRAAIAGQQPVSALHFGQLDSLRAIAIGLVMIEHYARPLASLIPTGPGSLGVNLFFVLSGYLITSGLLRDAQKAMPLRAVLVPFFIKRFFRLFPLYYLALILLTLAGVERVAEGLPWHALYLSNVYVSFGGASTIFWSLAVEEQFYLILPLIMFAAPGRGLGKRLCMALAACVAYKVVILALGLPLNWRLLPAAAEPLLIGCLLALGMSSGNRLTDAQAGRLRGAAWLALFASVTIWFWQSQWARHVFNQGLNGLFFAYVVYVCVQGVSGAVGRILNLKSLQFVGKISYGLYVVHSFVPDMLRSSLPGVDDKWIALLTLPVVLLICTISYFFYERPLLRFGHALARDVAARLSSGTGSIVRTGA